MKRVKAAMKEAARVYSKIRQMHIDVEFLDIGGGAGAEKVAAARDDLEVDWTNAKWGVA